MPKAIETKYLPCTAHRGSRIKAYTKRGNSRTISYPLEARNEHLEAAKALRDDLGWEKCDLIEGGKADGGHVFTLFNTRKLTYTIRRRIRDAKYRLTAKTIQL